MSTRFQLRLRVHVLAFEGVQRRFQTSDQSSEKNQVEKNRKGNQRKSKGAIKMI